MNELVIRGGTVVDGTGAPGRRPTSPSTAAASPRSATACRATRVLDADGHVVAPGFIDIHTHYDAQVFWDPALTPSCFHGVTTVVAGNCGFSIAPDPPRARRPHRPHPRERRGHGRRRARRRRAVGRFATFPEYLAAVERHGLGLNFAAYVGHTALRLFVDGRRGLRAGRHARGDRRDAARSSARRSTPAPPASRPASRHPPRRRRQAGAEPPRRPRRARRAPGHGRREAAAASSRSPPASWSASPTCTSCSPRSGCRSRITALLTIADRQPPDDARPQPGRLGRRRRGLAAGVAASARASRCRWPSRSRSTSTRSSPS